MSYVKGEMNKMADNLSRLFNCHENKVNTKLVEDITIEDNPMFKTQDSLQWLTDICEKLSQPAKTELYTIR